MNNPNDILHPLVAQVALVGAVWLYMYYTRLTTLYRDRVRTQDLADDAKFDAALSKVKAPAENFENQFELPILFFMAILLFRFSTTPDDLDLRLAWVFVFSRLAHSFIHCTINLIKARFVAYLIGAIALWWLWIRLAIRLME